MMTIKQRVSACLEEDPNASVLNMAQTLSLTEGEVTFALPDNILSRAQGKATQMILEALPSFGHLTTIVHSGGSVFEFKAPFPKGKMAHGYYNLMGKEGQLQGHLRIDLVCDIAFVSKDFRGMQSHYMGFFDAAGLCIFKVYLGRDKKRALIGEQIERFNALKQTWSK